jgi:hypothetical protein
MSGVSYVGDVKRPPKCERCSAEVCLRCDTARLIRINQLCLDLFFAYANFAEHLKMREPTHILGKLLAGKAKFNLYQKVSCLCKDLAT